MTENGGVTVLSSDDEVVGSDLARADSYELTAEDYDEIPELTDEMIARADMYVGDRLVRRGQSTPPKEQVRVTGRPASTGGGEGGRTAG